VHADVVVVGAGPAGAAAATALRQAGFSVCILERPSTTPWPLGENLTSQTTPELERLGLLESLRPPLCLPCEGIDSCWGSDEVEFVHPLMNPFGAGWLLDRGAFDQLLRSTAISAGAVLVEHSRVRSIERATTRWQLRLGPGAGAGAGELSASFIIDATGRRRSLAHTLGARSRIDSAGDLAIAACLTPLAQSQPLEGTLLLESVECGWWYSAPLPGSGAVAVFMTDAGVLRDSRLSPEDLWKTEFRRTGHTRDRLDNFRLDRVRVLKCGSSCLESPSGRGWAAVGDAAMTFDPLSAAGLQKALGDGIEVAADLCAGGANPHLVLERYSAARLNEYRRYLQDLGWYYGRERRWSASPYWRRRVESVGRALASFPSLTESHAPL